MKPGGELHHFLRGIMLASPWITGLSVFTLYPVLASLYYSFCDYSVLTPAVWTGGSNYAHLIHNTLFWVFLKNTLTFAFFSIPFGLVVALALALPLNCALLYLTQRHTFTLAVALQSYQQQHGGVQWHHLMAASAVVILPVIVPYFLAQKTFVAGIATTGIKG